MNILICNDDGYLSQGIDLLYQIANEIDHVNSNVNVNVQVVAPERDRSGVSNSLTLDRPMKIKLAENGFYYVSGTPTDCIHLALHAVYDIDSKNNFKPDLIISGVNHGANMGDDTLYSGTVAAATEGYLMGIPAVAFSLNSSRMNCYADTVRKAVKPILQKLIDNPPRMPILWNVNIPAVQAADLKGHQITRLGKRHHVQSIVPAKNPRGEDIYWIGAIGEVADNEQGTDFAAVEAGFVSITPLQVDLTAYNQIDNLKLFWKDLDFS